ncbi:hypothetical protein PGT21_022141, partial [Puccinia graminis f. sp. tritici]
MVKIMNRATKKKERAHQQLQTGGSERPINVDNSCDAPPNQGRHFTLPTLALGRLKPSWEYVENHCPSKEICGDVDTSNIVSTKCCQPTQITSAIDQQPEIVNLVQPVTMAEAMASPKEKPMCLEAMT